jgi:phage tail tube protein FII
MPINYSDDCLLARGLVLYGSLAHSRKKNVITFEKLLEVREQNLVIDIRGEDFLGFIRNALSY